MAGNDTMFKFSSAKPRPDQAVRGATPKVDTACDNHSVVLDMGEASRLEGFRQNGCR
jgi:hypothetical protein